MSPPHNLAFPPTSAPTRPARDPRTGQILPGSVALNPGGRRKSHRKYLAKLIGENAEEAFDGILRIARGQETYETLAREPGPEEDVASAALIPKVRKFPTIRERLDAWQILAEHMVGKPQIDIDVTHQQVEAARDFSRLSDAQLEQLERFLVLTEPALSPSVDGEFAVEPAALPEGSK